MLPSNWSLIPSLPACHFNNFCRKKVCLLRYISDKLQPHVLVDALHIVPIEAHGVFQNILLAEYHGTFLDTPSNVA